MKPELHLFIIWHHALNKAEQILSDIALHFTILDVYEITWSDGQFSNNMSRFYGQKLPAGSGKEVHCGRGPFYLVLVRDTNPVYEQRKTSRGDQIVNVSMFDAKERYRALTGGGHRIHGTNSPTETSHDLMLLLGQETGAFLAAHENPWDSVIKPVGRDVAGAVQWESLGELFTTLNATIPYAVLRNFEGLPHSATLPGHGDIDLLCSSRSEMRFIMNAVPVAKESYRVLHTAKVGTAQLLFDFREVGDNYYDELWQKKMLKDRVISPRGFYHLSDRDYFYSLFYHATIHKPSIAPDYIKRLILLAEGITPLTEADFSNPEKLRDVLALFMQQQGYGIVEPNDVSVFFNTRFTGERKISLPRIFASSKSAGQAIARILAQSTDCHSDTEIVAKEFSRSPVIIRHFSLMRSFVLKNLGLQREWRVLELGAETGVCTRYLGEVCAQVTAVEEDRDFAQAISLRCKDIPSVTVVTASPWTYEDTLEYDAVVLMIDAESSIYKAGKFGEVLANACRHVSRQGRLIVCVDSGEGLKKLVTGVRGTLTGATVEHLLTKSTMRSLILEVRKALRECGFTGFKNYYPFPDFIEPRGLFTESAVAKNEFSFGYYAAQAVFTPDTDVELFLSAGNVSVSGGLDALASSVCMVAARDGGVLKEQTWLYRGANAGHRATPLRCTAEVASKDLVPRLITCGRTHRDQNFIFEPNCTTPLYEGSSLEVAMLFSMIDRDFKAFLELLAGYALALTAEYSFRSPATYPWLTGKNELLITGNALDFVPFRLICEQGRCRFFEQPWRFAGPLPLSFIMVRGITSLAQRCGIKRLIESFSLSQEIDGSNAYQVIMYLLTQSGSLCVVDPVAYQQMAHFATRFEIFMKKGTQKEDKASLFELYYAAINEHVAGDRGSLDAAMQRLLHAYPDVPQVRALQEMVLRD